MTKYIYKGQEISHTKFLTICQMAGVMGGRKKSHYDKLVEMAQQGNPKAQAILNDLEVDNSNTITLYLINQYEAYIAAEQGIIAVRNMPTDTIDYKHELLEQAEVELPNGFSIEKTQGGEEIFKGNEAAELVTEFTGGKYVTSLVTSDGIQTLKVWNYGRD